MLIKEEPVIDGNAIYRDDRHLVPAVLAFTDVTVLVGDNRTGLECARILRERGIEAVHTFGETKQRQRDRKLGLYMGDGRVKATTIHSFKGWETGALVLHIARAVDETSLKAAYVGFTRLKVHLGGSYLTVVGAARELAELGRTMSGFQDCHGRYPRKAAAAFYDDVPF